MEEVAAFRIGLSNREHVIVSPSRREFDASDDYWDGNWVYATVTIASGAFRGEFEAMLRAEDFVRFRDAAHSLQSNLSGRAAFVTLEEWLRIDIEGDGIGHFHAKCSALDRPGCGNRLEFGIAFDQTELPAIVTALQRVCAAFPVVGSPSAPR